MAPAFLLGMASAFLAATLYEVQTGDVGRAGLSLLAAASCAALAALAGFFL